MRPTPTRLPLGLFLLLCGAYLLLLSGHTYSADEETMIAVAEAMLRRGEVAPDPSTGAPLAALRPGPDGRGYAPYGVLPSLLALPAVALGDLLGGPGGAYLTRLLASASSGPITAASAALLASWALRLGAPRPWALLIGLLYGLGSFALVYSRTFFSEPLAGLLILLAAERAWSAGAAHAGGDPGWRRDLLLAGLAGGLLLATRIAAGVALPVIGLYVLWVCWRAAGGGEGAGRRALRLAAGAAPFALGLTPGLALVAWYNLARFGTPLASGYASEAGLFTTPLGEGLYGLLLSPGKGALLYAPPLLLGLLGSAPLWRRGRAGVVLLGWGLFLGHLLLYARWGEWAGGGVWGPRFLLPVLAPLLLLAAGMAPAGAGAGGRGRAWGLALGLGLLGLLGNLGGALLNFNTYVVLPTPADKLYSLSGSPLAGHWRLLGERWAAALLPPRPGCALGEGWHRSESPAGAALPRRAGAAAELRCAAGAPLLLRFTLDDRRPPQAPPSGLRLAVGGQDLGALPAGQLREYRLLLPPGAPLLTLEAATWNPLAAGFSERADDLGPQIDGLRGREAPPGAAPLALVDAAVAPLPTGPRQRWAWYFDPPNRHLADHWAWHLPRSELAGPGAWALAALILGLGGGMLGLGARMAIRNA